MKRLFLSTLLLSLAFAASAQSIIRTGVFVNEDGTTTINLPNSIIAISLQVEERVFTPGVYARYAQKYLGLRAPLTANKQTNITAVTLATVDAEPNEQYVALPQEESAERVALPSNRMNNRSLSPEEQAAATADMIFSLRKHRIDLITGESGENVFGAGLSAALDEITRLENEYSEMFYGTTDIKTSTETFYIVPSGQERDYILCRYRNNAGILPLTDLSGDAVILHIEPAGEVNIGGLVLADEKTKNRVACVVANEAECSLLCGTRELAKAILPLYQYGKRIEVVTTK